MCVKGDQDSSLVYFHYIDSVSGLVVVKVVVYRFIWNVWVCMGIDHSQ